MAQGTAKHAAHVDTLRSLRRPLLEALVLLLTAAPIEAQAQAVVEYYAVDALGSVRVVFDAAGAVTARSDYLPFGEAWAPSGNLPAVRFTGQQRDAEDGWDHFNVRNLSVRLGRFNRLDPIGGSLRESTELEPVAYALNNPLRFTDPTGMYSTPSTNCDQARGAYWCPGNVGPANVDDAFNPDMYGYQGGEEQSAGESQLDLQSEHENVASAGGKANAVQRGSTARVLLSGGVRIQTD